MVSLGRLFIVFFRIGLFTLGGGYAMVPLMEREVVDGARWVAAGEFLELLALAQTLPGPIALNVATAVGYRRRGLAGALAAAAGVVLPSLMCMSLLAALFTGVRDNEHVVRVFWGLRPAVTALVAAAVVQLGRKAKLGPGAWAAAAGVALLVWRWPTLAMGVVVAAAAVGALLCSRRSGFG